MPSITTWNRLEPRCRDADMRAGLQARIHDPLWLLARQWQLGEFKGEDAGSPVLAVLQADGAPITRYAVGAPTPATPGAPTPPPLAGQPYDARTMPLEALVEREAIRPPAATNLRLAVDAGRHFARLLSAAGAGKYLPAYLRSYAVQPPPEPLDADSSRFLALVGGRAIDGGRLYRDLAASLRAGGQPALPAIPQIAQADRARVLAAAQSWLAWYDALFDEPAGAEQAWIPERMEYQFTVAAPAPNGEYVLAAPEYVEGRLEWYDFTQRAGVRLGASADAARLQAIRQTTIPAPVTYPGMPGDRWWEFEDAEIDFGSVEAGPDDLVRMLLVEFALIYGNDWFVIPVELDVGTLCRVSSLVVQNSFGEQITIPPFEQAGGMGAGWRMFGISADRSVSTMPSLIWMPPPQSLFFLPPALGGSVQGPPIEELHLLRDELANLAWAVERTVEGPAGRPYSPRDDYASPSGADQSAPADGRARYRLMSGVPGDWVPLVPVRDPQSGAVRLQRGAILDASGGGQVRARGRILASNGPLFIRDEEVPRAGARVTRAYQLARWVDGSTHVWVGRRKEPGRGEGSSGLRFDMIGPEPLG
jgi:hypothetical protein